MNSDLKRLFDNFLSLSLLKVCNLLLPLVTLPYLINTLSVEKYGVIVLSLSIAMYFQTFIEYGFNLSATREIAKSRSSKNKLEFIYSKVMLSKLILLSISTLLLYSALYFFPAFYESKRTYSLISLILIGYALFPEWFFRGMERMRYIALLDFCIKISFTICVFSFIKDEKDVWLYPTMLGCALIIVSIISHLIIAISFGVRFKYIRIKTVYRNLKKSFPLFVNQFFPNLYNNTTTFLVGIILGSYAVGVFGAIKQVVTTLNVFNSVSTTVLYPYLNRNKHHFSKYAILYLSLLTFITMAFISLSGVVISYLDIDRESSSLVYSILAIGVLFIGVYSVFSTNYLLTYNKDKLVMKITSYTSIVGFLSSYPLITSFGLIGAALNVFLCQVTLGTTAFWFYKKHTKEKLGLINE